MRLSLCAVVLLSTLATGGCTIAGTAIGAATPRYDSADDWERAPIALGTKVRVHMRSVGSDARVPDRVEGRYGGIREGLLSVTDEEGREHELPARDVSRIEVRQGTQWAKGLLLGAAADTIIAVAVVAVSEGANVSIATGR